MRRQAEEEVKLGAGKPDEAEVERQGISAMCAALHVNMHEINPDGHWYVASHSARSFPIVFPLKKHSLKLKILGLVNDSLYAAVADQLNLRRKVSRPTDYKAARAATAQEMRTHPDEYKPFISDSDEHMAGIVNKEAGTLNTEQAQESESQSPSPPLSRWSHSKHQLTMLPDLSMSIRVLPGLLRSGGKYGCVGWPARDPRAVEGVPYPDQRRAGRRARAQSGRGRVRRRAAVHFVPPQDVRPRRGKFQPDMIQR